MSAFFEMIVSFEADNENQAKRMRDLVAELVSQDGKFLVAIAGPYRDEEADR